MRRKSILAHIIRSNPSNRTLTAAQQKRIAQLEKQAQRLPVRRVLP